LKPHGKHPSRFVFFVKPLLHANSHFSVALFGTRKPLATGQHRVHSPGIFPPGTGQYRFS
jgi:hypothetical protein